VEQVDTAMLQDRLAGRTIADAQQYLITEVDLIDGALPEIVLSPEFMPSLPLLGSRIEIVLEESAD
jgi:hypothetical protein